MLRELLLRDVAGCHRRVLIGSGVSVALILATWTLATRNDPDWIQGAGPILGIMLFLGSVIPVSLHLREGMLGTLGDLLALPVSRREVVRLRFAEGILACLLCVGVYLLVTVAVFHPSGAVLRGILRLPALFWVPAVAISYPMPFVLRGKPWSFLAPALMAVLLPGWMALRVFGPDSLNRLVDGVIRWGYALHGLRLGALGLDDLLPVLLLLGSYRLSVWAFERGDA